MPYGISSTTGECSGWATVKLDDDALEVVACHESKQEAVDQMVALSIAEEIEPLGDVSRDMEPEEEPLLMEARQEPDLAAPAFMAASAERGLRLHEEGHSGSGLRPQTVADARRMAQGEISEAKWRKIGPWIARHIVDLDAVEDGEITPGLVAMLLWGGGSSRASAQRAQRYAERIVARLDEERVASRGEETMSDTIIEPATYGWISKPVDERRSVAFTNLEIRSDGTNRLVGYAAVFDSPSEPMPFTEYVKRGAFAKTLNDGADVRLLIDHEGVPLARSRSGTLSLSEDDRGLLVEADLDPANPDAQKVISALRRGDLSQMSFAFRTIKDSWSADRLTRELREVQLYDVSVVTYPAYEETVAELRSRSEAVTLPPVAPSRLRSQQVALARAKRSR